MTDDEIRKEAKEDMGKDALWLVGDVYVELLKEDRPLSESARHSSKRFAGLLGKFIFESIKSQEKMDKMTEKLVSLTTGLYVFTIVVVLLTLVVARKDLRDMFEHFLKLFR